jgi:plasmid stabilization system protein ParE
VRPPIKTARSVNDWVNTNPELLKKYPDTAWYLAPQDPGFDFSTWSMLLASGFRVSKALQNEDGTMGPLLRDMLAARGELQHNATVADFQADIDQLDVRVPEQAEQIKALEDERDALLEMNRDQNPWWGKKYAETRNPVARNQVAQDALTEVKRMVDNLYAETPEPEFENSSAYWLRTAVYTYLDFAADIRSIEGRDRDSVERKKALEYELGTYLDYIGEQSPNADLFIRNVLRSNPDIGSLDLNPLGVGRG